MKCRVGAGLAFLGLLAAATGWAHHSVQAQFDLDKPLNVTGVVTKVEWINPHSYLYLDAKDDSGKVTHWAFEMAGPGALRKAGLSRSDRGGLKAGRHHHSAGSARQGRHRYRADQGSEAARRPCVHDLDQRPERQVGLCMRRRWTFAAAVAVGLMRRWRIRLRSRRTPAWTGVRI